jgi:hypothetical protein
MESEDDPIEPTEYAKDTARLLAAAPQLYRAVRQAYDWMKNIDVWYGSEMTAVWKALSAAVERIDGEQTKE